MDARITIDEMKRAEARGWGYLALVLLVFWRECNDLYFEGELRQADMTNVASGVTTSISA
jgi:hypothetical protein